MAANTGPLDLSNYISGVTKKAEQSWGRSDDQYDWAKEQFGKNRQVADQVQGAALDTQRTGLDWAKTDRGDYDKIYRPAMAEQMDFARGYTTPGRMAANRGSAMAGVNTAFDASADAAKRSLMGYGVDPTSGRFAGLDAALEAKRAAAGAAAGTKSDRDTEMMGQQLLANAIRTGQVLPGQAANEAATGLAGGRQAIDTGLATTASGANTMGTGMQWSALGNDMYKEWANAAKAETQAGLEGRKLDLEQQKLAQSDSSGLGSMIGMGAGILGGIAMPGGGSFAGTLLSSAMGGMGGPKKAHGGLIHKYADGGITDMPEEDDEISSLPEMMPDSMEEMPMEEEGDQMVTTDMSPSAGGETDDVPAMLNEGEFVVPKDVTAWHGEKFFQKLIEKARQEMTQRVAEPDIGPPVQATAMAEPTFASPGTQAARGGMINRYQNGGIGQLGRGIESGIQLWERGIDNVIGYGKEKLAPEPSGIGQGIGDAIRYGKEQMFPEPGNTRPLSFDGESYSESMFPLKEHEDYLRRSGKRGAYQYEPRMADRLAVEVNKRAPAQTGETADPPWQVKDPQMSRRMIYENALENATPEEQAQLWRDYKADMKRLDPNIVFEDEPQGSGIPNYQGGGQAHRPFDPTDPAGPPTQYQKLIYEDADPDSYPVYEPEDPLARQVDEGERTHRTQMQNYYAARDLLKTPTRREEQTRRHGKTVEEQYEEHKDADEAKENIRRFNEDFERRTPLPPPTFRRGGSVYRRQPPPRTAFDPNSAGYDDETADWEGMQAEISPEDNLPHGFSRVPRTGLLLKGRQHPTFDKAVEEDRRLGYGLEMRDGRYYTQPFKGN